MIIKEIKPNKDEIEQLIELSKIWVKEDITFGYIENSKDYILDKTVIACILDNTIIGYAYLKEGISKNYSSIIPDGSIYLEVDELYVIKEYRDQGIGTSIMNYIKDYARKHDYKYLFLVSSTKSANKIIDFYIDKCNLTFYCASFVEKL